MTASLLIAAALSAAAHAKRPPTPAKVPAPAPICEGDYSDALTPDVTARVQQQVTAAAFVYLVRNTATYEHVYYGHDGKLRRAYLRSVIHGTAFAYKQKDGESYLITNDHVAEQPEVTDDDHLVDGVPPGSKKVREVLKIVHSDSDDYEPGHIAVTRALADQADDIGLLKTHAQLSLMPYRLGRSNALRSGNLITARGFPLGEFAAVNSGKVINPTQIDTEKSWNHVDFVIDALLNSGNSGSPVFAVSCHTGELELVGVYHAGYKDAAALNVVVGIDQLKEMLETLRPPRRDHGPKLEITAADRDRVVNALFEDPTHALVFPFAGRAVRVALADRQTIRFSLLDSDFPLLSTESIALIDQAANGFGTLDSVMVRGPDGAATQEATALDPDVRDHLQRFYDQIWRQLIGVLDYRLLAAHAASSADAHGAAQTARAALSHHANDNHELLETCLYDVDRIAAMPKAVIAAGGANAPAARPPADAPTPDGDVGVR